MKLGIRLESVGVPIRRGMEEAERLGVSGVQVDALGELSPNALTQTGRRAFRHLLRSHGLELTALGCPLRRGFDAAEELDARIDHVKKVLQLGFDLGPRIVIVQAGRVSKDEGPAANLMTEALRALAYHGDRVGAVLALETGLESGAVLGKFLARFDSGGLGVNLDPANLLMHDFDPYESARALRERVVHVHAKDARAAGASRASQEVPLGHGDIDWLQFLSVLEEINYRGWLTLERETGDCRRADLAAGVSFLRRFVR